MGVAAAQQLPCDTRAQRLQNIVGGGVRILLDVGIPVEHWAAQAVSAMHSLFVYECLLDGVRVVRRTQTLDGKDAVTCTIRDCRSAGANRLAVQQHGAATALAEAAAEFWSVEFQVFLQN